MSELREVLDSIKAHCSTEYREHYQNLSIGRGELMMKDLRSPMTLWIVNAERTPSYRKECDITGAVVSTSSTGRKDTYNESGSWAVSKTKNSHVFSFKTMKAITAVNSRMAKTRISSLGIQHII